MSLPKFTAEASLYKTSESYRLATLYRRRENSNLISGSNASMAGQGVFPQQYSFGRKCECYGDPDCNDLIGYIWSAATCQAWIERKLQECPTGQGYYAPKSSMNAGVCKFCC